MTVGVLQSSEQLFCVVCVLISSHILLIPVNSDYSSCTIFYILVLNADTVMVLMCQQLTVIKDHLTLSFLVDDEDALVDTAADEFNVNAPIYVGGVPHSFRSPVETLVSNDKACPC